MQLTSHPGALFYLLEASHYLTSRRGMAQSWVAASRILQLSEVGLLNLIIKGWLKSSLPRMFIYIIGKVRVACLHPKP